MIHVVSHHPAPSHSPHQSNLSVAIHTFAKCSSPVAHWANLHSCATESKTKLHQPTPTPGRIGSGRRNLGYDPNMSSSSSGTPTTTSQTDLFPTPSTGFGSENSQSRGTNVYYLVVSPLSYVPSFLFLLPLSCSAFLQHPS